MRLTTILFALALLAGCKHSKPASTPSDNAGTETCREDAGDDVATAGRTGVEGAKTGIYTAGAGIKQAGQAGAGLVEGGTTGAKERWNEGKVDTKATANEGAANTRKASSKPRCHGR